VVPTTQAHFCSFEAAYANLCSGRQIEPTIAACALHEDGKRGERRYELFLVHAKRLRATQHLGVRLLPFPTVMRLQVSEISTRTHTIQLDGLTSVPDGLCIALPPLFAPRTFTIDDPSVARIWDRTVEIGRFYAALANALMHGRSPSTAWVHAQERYPVTAEHVPIGLRSVFGEPASCDSSVAITTIRELWERPFDAPILTTFVYPELLRRLAEDSELRYTPRNSREDRDRYLRLHIPIEDLEAEDQSIGWLPNTAPYRDERELTRFELLR
jgi:hypothetical protein